MGPAGPTTTCQRAVRAGRAGKGWKGGYGSWPGLSNEQFNEVRDMVVTTDLRRVLGETAYKTLGAWDRERVFPGAQLAPGSFLNFVQGAGWFGGGRTGARADGARRPTFGKFLFLYESAGNGFMPSKRSNFSFWAASYSVYQPDSRGQQSPRFRFPLSARPLPTLSEASRTSGALTPLSAKCPCCLI
jgi:hypothetical protein